MAIKTATKTVSPPNDGYPKLRKTTCQAHPEYGYLVILFLGRNTGIPLSGVSPDRIGRQEQWTPCDGNDWEPASITMQSMD